MAQKQKKEYSQGYIHETVFNSIVNHHISVKMEKEERSPAVLSKDSAASLTEEILSDLTAPLSFWRNERTGG